MPLSSVDKQTILTGVANAAAYIKKTVTLAVELDGAENIKWGTMGSTNIFTDYAKRDRSPTDGRTLEMVCWLWPIYLAWRTQVAKDAHLQDFDRNTIASIGAGQKLTDAGKYAAFGSRDESAMAAAAFYRASLSTQGLGSVGDIVFYYRQGYDQPCHIAIQVSNTKVSSLWNVPRDAQGHYYWNPQTIDNAVLLNCISTENNGAVSECRSGRPPWA
jgi:hypothetical protein